MADETEQKTLQDLFRVINDMRAEMNTRFDAAGVERQEMRKSIDEVKGETQAIREVVDTLASQEDFADLDRKISSVSADTQAARQSPARRRPRCLVSDLTCRQPAFPFAS